MGAERTVIVDLTDHDVEKTAINADLTVIVVEKTVIGVEKTEIVGNWSESQGDYGPYCLRNYCLDVNVTLYPGKDLNQKP